MSVYLKYKELTVPEKDIRIEVADKQPFGGQRVGVGRIAVKVTHLPSLTVVIYDSERSQMKNKELAIKELMEILYENHWTAAAGR